MFILRLPPRVFDRHRTARISMSPALAGFGLDSQWITGPSNNHCERANDYEVKTSQNDPRLKLADLLGDSFPSFPN
jgi:hypothetical protein